MLKFRQLREFVLALSGAHGKVLELVPSERARFESLGWAILITSCMAAISMWFALSSALGINGILAIPVALFWGLVIMGIDRWLIVSMPVDSGRKFAMAVPRVLLAVLLGTLISTPLVLRIFQSEINAQIAEMQQTSYSSFLKEQRSSQVDQQVTTYGQELNQLNTVIASHGTQTGNTAADPQLVQYNKQLATLDGQLANWTKLKAKYYQDYICQKYGGADCPKKGVGPAAQAAYASYQQASAEVSKTQGEINTVQGEIQQRDRQLTSTSKAAQQARYQQALVAQPVVQGEYNAAVQRRNQLQATFFAQEQASHGILMRLEALSELSNGNPTVTAARFLLFLLFLVIECLPVTVKLLQRPGQYEVALGRAKQAEQRDFEKYFATTSRFGSGGLIGSAAAGRPPVVLQLQPEPPDRMDPSIWEQTRVLPMGQAMPPEEQPTEAFTDPGGYARAGGASSAPPPPDAASQQGHWRGADAWRGDWGEPELDEPRREEPAPPRLALTRVDRPEPAPTRHDVPVARTRLDYEYAAEAAPDGYYQSGPEDNAVYYPGADEPAYGAAGEHAAEPMPPRSEDDATGIDLTWEDD
jgi:hypothetical protein